MPTVGAVSTRQETLSRPADGDGLPPSASHMQRSSGMTDSPAAAASATGEPRSRLDGKPFFCRQWAFTKISQCLQHKQSKLGGALVVGGVGCGKTALCSELARPTAATGRQLSLHARLVAHHFCRAEQADSLRPGTFVLQLTEQLARSRLLPGYAEKLRDPDVQEVLTPVFCGRQPDEALRRAVLFPLLELDEPPQPLLLVVDGVDDAHRAAGGGGSLAALLASHQHLLPRWLLLVVTSRRTSRDVTRLFAGFRKVDTTAPGRPLVMVCIGGMVQTTQTIDTVSAF